MRALGFVLLVLTAVAILGMPSVLFGGCRIVPGPVPPPPDPNTTDAAPPDRPLAPPWDYADPCGSALARLEWIGCEPAVKPETGTWIDACRNARAHAATFGVPCIQVLMFRTAAPACGVTCRP